MPLQFRNPFGFWSVIGLALSVGVLILIGRAIYDYFGATGAIAGAAAMGFFDVDAMTVSMTRLEPNVATQAILVGVASNTLAKATIAALVERRRFALEIAAMSFACILSGGLLTLVLT
jgi:uncharacterized membrane protein (DUF4010 family)